MMVTGYRIQHSIRELSHLRDVLASQFNDHIKQFRSAPNLVDIRQIHGRYCDVERRLAQLQTIQTRYNLAVNVVVAAETIPLLQAVKEVGGAGRAEKMWRTVAKGGEANHYSYDDHKRASDTEYAELSVPIEEAYRLARQAHKRAGALREAIQVGNNTEIEMADLDASLFNIE